MPLTDDSLLALQTVIHQAWWQARYLEDVAAHAREGGAAAPPPHGVRVLLDARAAVFQCLWKAQGHLERGAAGVWRNKITGCVRARVRVRLLARACVLLKNAHTLAAVLGRAARTLLSFTATAA